MILGVATVLMVAIALLAGGRLRNLAQLELRMGWLTLVALMLQVLVIYTVEIRWLTALLIMASYGLLAMVVAANHHIPGMALISLGLLANILVIAANGGYMPVTPEAVSRAGLGHIVTQSPEGAFVVGSKDVLLSRAETRLWPLSDVLVLGKPWQTVFSPGDLVLACGLLWLVIKALRPSFIKEPAVLTDAGSA
jgi:hypothetical protein